MGDDAHCLCVDLVAALVVLRTGHDASCGLELGRCGVIGSSPAVNRTTVSLRAPLELPCGVHAGALSNPGQNPVLEFAAQLFNVLLNDMGILPGIRM